MRPGCGALSHCYHIPSALCTFRSVQLSLFENPLLLFFAEGLIAAVNRRFHSLFSGLTRQALRITESVRVCSPPLSPRPPRLKLQSNSPIVQKRLTPRYCTMAAPQTCTASSFGLITQVVHRGTSSKQTADEVTHSRPLCCANSLPFFTRRSGASIFSFSCSPFQKTRRTVVSDVTKGIPPPSCHL